MQEHTTAGQDPNLWLEEIDSPRALGWVGERNAEAETELSADAHYAPLKTELKTILDSKERIPYAALHGDWLYNFWKDADHPRGLWRRTTLDEFRQQAPRWETVLDLDALAATEDENWIWAGSQKLPPRGDRALVSLSRGGGDAHVVREFDLTTCAFVPAEQGGFALPEAKSSVGWIDHDSIFVATDFGEGSMTSSGYPRIVKQWRRGMPLAAAVTVYEVEPDDLSASAWQDATPGFERQFVQRQIDFYSSEMFLRSADGDLVKIDKPEDANAFTVRDQLIVELRSDWHIDASAGGHTYPQGALLAMDFERFMAGERAFEILFVPSPTTSLDGVAATRSMLLLTILDKVKNRIVELQHVDGAWQRREVEAPGIGSLDVSAVDEFESDDYFLNVTDFLTPSSFYLAHAGSDRRELLKSMPGFFDAGPYAVHQYEAASADGTKVPYFVVMRKDTELNGANPTLLYGYGGFEVSLTPFYSGVTGKAWLEQGGVYVLANIRGGGEFGPRWHQAALKENRQKAFDDFIAVAEDLVRQRITSSRHLGIMGGSNGGLLVGAVLVQRPDLFNAVVCQVPLLDMQRYHLLLAGASWMGEYGDPDDPAEWAAIGRYSPYQNVSAQGRYPRVLFTTSTRDDRVHPGHARKMAQRMRDQGHDVLYWENTEGGHAGAANNEQTAKMWALTYAFLLRQLK
jgi:prolyl oligopeptidase